MEKKLYRSSTNTVLAGVCAGIGEYTNIDPTIVRLVTAFLFFGSFGSGLVIYLVVAIIIPRRPEFTNASTTHEYTNSKEDFVRPSEEEVEEVKAEDIKSVNDKSDENINSKKINLDK